MPWQRPALLECGLPDGTRADAISYHMRTHRIHIVEAKASRQDFMRGRDKFDQYRAWCDLFYIAAPEGLIRSDELPKGVGLLRVTPHFHDGKIRWCSTSVVKRAQTQLMEDSRRGQVRDRFFSWLLSFYEARIVADRLPGGYWW